MSGADILLLALVGLALFFALRNIRRRKKSGRYSCGGTCSSCAACKPCGRRGK